MNATDVTCSYCEAPPGLPCEDRGTGADRERPHFTRAAAAMRSNDPCPICGVRCSEHMQKTGRPFPGKRTA